ncbi:MAG: hypothetical protein WC421_02845 [Elusimicrobiales bacterium]
MTMWSFFTDAVAKWGLAAMVLVFWYLDSKEQKKLFRTMLAQQQQQADQHFAQTERMLEQLQYLSGQMSRVENKADTNQFCPITRGGSKPQ